MNHIMFAHGVWQSHLKPGSHVIDATSGNGKDTLFLANLVLPSGRVDAFDIQEIAIQNTKILLETHLTKETLSQIHLHLSSHEELPFEKSSIDLIAYNLGYLPGGDKSITTKTSSSLSSISKALSLLAPLGLISITLYPGHPEGYTESLAILEFAKTLPVSLYSARHYLSCNHPSAPSVLIIKKM